MKMMGTLHSCCFSLACNSRPDIFGMRMSTIKHPALPCKSDSRNAFADPKHCASNPPDSIRSLSESCIDSLSSMMAINLDLLVTGMLPTQYRLINHADARLFTERANRGKWNSGNFAIKWE